MVTPELIEFIKKEEAKGVSRESIISLLRTQSWTEVDIMEAFDTISPKASLNTPSPIQAVPIQPVTSLMYQPKSGKKIKILLSLVLLLILVIGGTLAYASGYIVALNKIFSKSIQSSKDNISVVMDMHTIVDISQMKNSEDILKSINGLKSTIDFNMKSAYETKDNNNLKSNSSLSVKSGTFEAALDFRIINESMYMSFTKAPNIGFFSLKPFENKWIVLPKQGSNELANNPLIPSKGLNPNFLNDLTEQQKEHIVEMTQKANFIIISKKHLPDLVAGSLSFHFDFDLDIKGIQSYLKELISYLKTLDQNSSQIPEFNDEDYNKIANSIKNFHGEAWIGIFDSLPHKVVANFDIINPDKPEEGVIRFNNSVVYTDWDKPVTVDIPKDTTTIEKLMSEVMGDMFGIPPSEIQKQMESQVMLGEESSKIITPTPIKNKTNQDNKVKDTIPVILMSPGEQAIIMDNMREQARQYSEVNGGTFAGFCTSNIKQGATTLAKTLPPGTVYKCSSSPSTTNWAAWSKLSNGTYYCVDWAGRSKNVGETPPANGSTSCPS